MLKIVCRICCGIDVHKTFVVACVASTNDKGITTYKTKRFSTYTKGLRELAEWLEENNCKDVCMESTGKYWHPVWNILETSCNLALAHPKYLKAICGKKTCHFKLQMTTRNHNFIPCTLFIGSVFFIFNFLMQIDDFSI